MDTSHTIFGSLPATVWDTPKLTLLAHRLVNGAPFRENFRTCVFLHCHHPPITLHRIPTVCFSPPPRSTYLHFAMAFASHASVSSEGLLANRAYVFITVCISGRYKVCELI